jgi:hypothetical protein
VGARLAPHPARVICVTRVSKPPVRRTRLDPGTSSRTPPLRVRATLHRVFALAVAPSLATVAALSCGTNRGGATPSIDASLLPDAGASGFDAALFVDDASACAPVPVEAGFFGEDGSCGKFLHLPCGIPSGLEGAQCFPNIDLCTAVCPQKFFFTCQFPAPTCEEGGLAPDAAVYLDCSTCVGNIGRRPVGFVSPRAREREERGAAASDVGRYFARVAYLERASVTAFVDLHARLVHLGAPPRLRRAARAAAADERRHTRVATRFAREHGARVAPPSRAQRAPLTLEALARDNAVEGCVRETFGVLIALHQAEHAASPRVARALRRIAEDEIRHAELAWSLHRWAVARLPPPAAGRVRAAQAEALAELLRPTPVAPPAVARAVGLPPAATAARLARTFALSAFGSGRTGGDCRGDRPSRRAAS